MEADPLRRRSVGAPAARSVLLTVLGEFLLPIQRTVWQETLVRSLGTVGVSVQAARQALARSARAGWLETQRQGRRTRMGLSESAAGMLRSGAERIYGFGAEEPWNGDWLIVVLRVPERRREVRDQLRTQLAWAGLGSLGGGVWITPRVEREGEVAEIMRGEGSADVVTFVGPLGALGEAATVARTAWDLASVADMYAGFVSEFSRARPKVPEAVFGQQTLLVHAWRKFPFLDPGLPSRMLPQQWPRARALELFRKRHDEWDGAARQYFQALDEALD